MPQQVKELLTQHNFANSPEDPPLPRLVRPRRVPLKYVTTSEDSTEDLPEEGQLEPVASAGGATEVTPAGSENRSQDLFESQAVAQAHKAIREDDEDRARRAALDELDPEEEDFLQGVVEEAVAEDDGLHASLEPPLLPDEEEFLEELIASSQPKMDPAFRYTTTVRVTRNPPARKTPRKASAAKSPGECANQQWPSHACHCRLVVSAAKSSGPTPSTSTGRVAKGGAKRSAARARHGGGGDSSDSDASPLKKRSPAAKSGRVDEDEEDDEEVDYEVIPSSVIVVIMPDRDI